MLRDGSPDGKGDAELNITSHPCTLTTDAGPYLHYILGM